MEELRVLKGLKVLNELKILNELKELSLRYAPLGVKVDTLGL